MSSRTCFQSGAALHLHFREHTPGVWAPDTPASTLSSQPWAEQGDHTSLRCTVGQERRVTVCSKKVVFNVDQSGTFNHFPHTFAIAFLLCGWSLGSGSPLGPQEPLGRGDGLHPQAQQVPWVGRCHQDPMTAQPWSRAQPGQGKGRGSASPGGS